MYILLVVCTIIAAVLLIGVVLIQKSKGGGLSSSFASINAVGGVRRTNSFIENVTWTLAGCIAVFAILSTFCMPSTTEDSRVSAPVQQEQTLPDDFATEAPAAASDVLPAAPTAAANPGNDAQGGY